MLKPDQVPDEVVKAYEDGRWNHDMSVAESIAAAINAWPGVQHRVLIEQAIILPLTEKTDD